MKWLSYKLWKEKNALKPSRAFRSALWKKLDSAWQDAFQPKTLWYQIPVFKYSLVALAVLIVVGSSGVGAYAYNSSEVTEGTVFYPVKRAIERVEEKVVERRKPEVQARFYLKQIERREAEEKVMVKRGRVAEQIQKVEEKIERTEKRLEMINVKLDETSEKIKDDVLKERIDKRLEIMEIKREKLKNKEINRVKSASPADHAASNLNLNQEPYEESNTSTGTGDVVGDNDAGAGRETRRQGETKERRASDTDADTE